MDRLDSEFRSFVSALRAFEIPSPTVYSVHELKQNPNWPWGYAKGLYCFVVDDEIVYVGRAIGAGTLGARIWSHINRQEPDWTVELDGTRATVMTFPFDESDSALVSALELHLIRTLQPRLNHRYG